MKYDDIDSDLAEKVAGAYRTHKQSNTVYCQFSDRTYMHRAVMERVLGRKLLRSEHVDHIDGDGTNNCRSNLRVATASQNAANSPARSGCTSKYKGATYYKRDNTWQAKISPRGKTLHLGYYATEEEAALAYNYMASSVYGEFANLNNVHA